MAHSYVTWSATTCAFPRAGLYIGLSPAFEQAMVARGLTAKQARVYQGGTMRIRPESETWPLNYIAVRDPSSVSVKPLNLPALANGFRHVTLVIRLGGAPALGRLGPVGSEEPAALLTPGTAGFVMTIGLPAELEEDFHRRAVKDYPCTDWAELFRRAVALGCREAS